MTILILTSIRFLIVNRLTSVTIIVSVAIASGVGFFTLSIMNGTNSERINELEEKVKVLYGGIPNPVHTNQITIPAMSKAYQSCNLHYSCVVPYIAEIHVGESITWINESDKNLQISQAIDFENQACRSTTGSVIDVQLASGELKEGYSKTVKFTKAGQYHWCSREDNNINGIVIVKES